jgi:hypothetical protein
VEPGVTVWGRAGGWVGTAQVMHLPLPKLHLLEAWCARLQGWEPEGCRSRGRVPLRRCAAYRHSSTDVLMASRGVSSAVPLGRHSRRGLWARWGIALAPDRRARRHLRYDRRGGSARSIHGANRWNSPMHASSKRARWVRTAMKGGATTPPTYSGYVRLFHNE